MVAVFWIIILAAGLVAVRLTAEGSRVKLDAG
jgi:hypothetical protein